MPKAISEKIKQKIAYLSEQENLSEAMIAQTVGVSDRTVRRYKKMDGLDQPRPDNNGKASSAVDRPSPRCPDKALEPTGRSRPDNTGQYNPDNRKGWVCKRCNYFTDKKQKFCPHCGSGPFDSIFLEIGSPKYEQFIEENQKQGEIEELENEEYAPDRIESKDPSKYKDPEPQDNEEPGDDNETNPGAVEEQQLEYEYECPKCRKEFNGVLENCPHCGIPLADAWECPKCRHKWYGSPDKCPKCGKELQE